MKFKKYILLIALIATIASCSNKEGFVSKKNDNVVNSKTAMLNVSSLKDSVVKTDETLTQTHKNERSLKDKGVTPSNTIKKGNITSNSGDALVYITSEADFNANILGTDKPSIVDFYADWCGPCRMLAPILKQLAEEYSGRAIVAKVNVDKLNELAGKYRVSGIPCVILFKNGKEIDRIVGLRSLDAYTTILNKALK